MPERSSSLQASKAAPGVAEQNPGVPLAASAGQAVPAPQGASAPDLSAFGPSKSLTLPLTPLQQQVLATLRERGADWTAAATERHWVRGETYYLDKRCGAREGLVRQFNQGNKDTLAAKVAALGQEG